MLVKNILQKFFRGYSVVERVESEINGLIEIREDLFWKRRLLAGGISQSGYSVERLWQKPIKRVREKGDQVRNCLILGLGAGSVAKVIHSYFPEAKIIGIEIDPLMIKMGKKHLGLSTVKNLEIRIGDAILIIDQKSLTKKQFDLILVDLYLGEKVLAKAKTIEFVKRVKKFLSPSGRIIFNRLYYGEKKKEVHQFESRLRKIFSRVEPLRVSANIFFVCS